MSFKHPEIESLSREQILQLQKGKLEALGARLEQSPDWKEHFAKAGMTPLDLCAEDGLQNAPTLEKSDLRGHYPHPFLSVPMSAVKRFTATSGTTGLPVLFGLTTHDLDVLLPYQMQRILNACGVQPGDRAYQGYGYGLWVGGLALDVGFQSLRCTNYPVGPGRGDLVVQWFKDHRYRVASMSPLWLMRLITLAHKAGVDPRTDWGLQIGILGGQSVSQAFRRQLEAHLADGFMAHNIYGTTEAGGPVLAISTPYTHNDDEMQLINEDTVLTEILDPDTLKPVSPGEVGEIVITTLSKEASPVVRWRTRDLTRLSPNAFDCPSGRRGFPRIGPIIGRTDDMLKVRGVMVFPTQIEEIIAQTDGTVKDAWQIYVDNDKSELDTLTVSLERRNGAPMTEDQLEHVVWREIQSRLGLQCQVKCHTEGALPRYEAKATRVIKRTGRN